MKNTRTGIVTKHADCLLCGKQLSASSTTNIRSHIQSVHREKMVSDLEKEGVSYDDKIPSMDDTSMGKVEPFPTARTRRLNRTYVKM